MKKIIFWIGLMLWAGTSFAQFNDTTNYYGNLTATGIINKTNDGNSYVLNNALKFNVYKKSYSLNSSNSWIYGENQQQLTNNDFTSSLDFNIYKTLPHLYYWGLATYETSHSLKINHRLQTGLGIGYNILDKPNAIIVLSDGILYEKSDLKTAVENVSDDYETLRNSFRVKFRFVLHEIITLDGTDFLQHSLSDSDDYIIRSNTNLSIKLKKWLSFTVSLTYNKLNRTQRENLLCNFGLTLERYF